MNEEEKKKMRFQNVELWKKKRLSENGEMVYTDISINKKAQDILKEFSVEGEQKEHYSAGIDENDDVKDIEYTRYLIKRVILSSLSSRGKLLFVKELVDNGKMTIETLNLNKGNDLLRDLVRDLRELAEVYSGIEVTSKTTIEFNWFI